MLLLFVFFFSFFSRKFITFKSEENTEPFSGRISCYSNMNLAKVTETKLHHLLNTISVRSLQSCSFLDLSFRIFIYS